jgi:D-threo-aldose 1-dehydrogenase
MTMCRGLELSRLALGCAPIGGLLERVGEDQARATVAAAHAVGVRTFDTAPLYGYGTSERRLGSALAAFPRTELVISTKVGRLLVPDHLEPEEQDDVWPGAPPLRPVFDFSADGVRRSLEASLERMGLDRVDIALIHDPDEDLEQALRETAPALVRLREEGLITAFGAGMNQTKALTRFVREADVDCVMVAGRYTLLDQSAADELLPASLDRGVAVLAAGVFNSGLLAKPSAHATYDYATAPPALIQRALRIEEVCARFDVPIAAAAMAFALRHPAVRCIVVGARSPEEMTADAALFARPIPGEMWDALADSGLMTNADVPAA